MAESDDLRLKVEELAAMVMNQPKQRVATPEAPKGLPNWEITERPSGGTYTPGTDWEPQFYEGGVNFIYYGIATVHGELPCLHPSNSNPAMCVLEFESSVPRDVNAYIAGENFGRLQMKVNSQTTAEYTAGQAITISVRAGKNTIVLMSNGLTDRIALRGGFF